MLTHTKLVQALIGTGLIIGMNSAMAGLWLDKDMQTAVTKDESNHYTTEGDAWLNGHTYFSPTNSVVTIGGSLYKVEPRKPAISIVGMIGAQILFAQTRAKHTSSKRTV